MCPKGNDSFPGGCKRIELIEENGNYMVLSRAGSLTEGCSQLSIVSSMPRISPQNLVYKRRKLTGNSLAGSLGKGQENTRRIGDCVCLVNCNNCFVTPNRKDIALESRREHGAIESTFSLILDSGLVNASTISEGLVDKAPECSVQRVLEVDSVNDSCSSSKSNIEQILSTFKGEPEEVSECSSSSVVAMNYMGEALLEKEYCIGILRSHGLLGKERCFESIEDINTGNVENHFKPCKICSRSETTIKLLVCDNCEEAFHMNCCKPRIKKVPSDEWFCHSCTKSGCKDLQHKVTENFSNNSNEHSGCRRKYNHIGLMLRNNEPYTTRVRIGKSFQAEVPEWSGPIYNDDGAGEPVEMDSSEFLFRDLNRIKTSKLGHISNWIQCREVLDGQNGTICGKWRRAPLFEVQTDEWECYCCVRWDAPHADCAVPQEIGTGEVLKQLKYIEKMRPRLLAKSKSRVIPRATKI